FCALLGGEAVTDDLGFFFYLWEFFEMYRVLVLECVFVFVGLVIGVVVFLEVLRGLVRVTIVEWLVGGGGLILGRAG
ncbi:hypothetical protein RA274_29425, partial [Pseudomonas syringae pv. tagetis]|uniref:hypothetical protein n=1 Tax=Pseudomonas syringae group genomosp. 7 TaxID=251699 RepID=UPI0037703802